MASVPLHLSLQNFVLDRPRPQFCTSCFALLVSAPGPQRRRRGISV